MGKRLTAYLISTLALVCVLYPLSFGERRDSFPLSDFPMFARGKTNAKLTQDFVAYLDDADTRRPVPPEIVANHEVLLAQATIRRAIAGGPAKREALCAEVASKLARDSDYAGARTVVVMRGTYDAVEYLSGRDRTGPERTFARCPVSR